jgi:glutathione S-transferase
VPVRFSEKDKIAFSGQTLVPILEHEDGYVNDSWEIIKWLDKYYPENKLFINETSKNFSYFLYLWTSRQLLPVLFKVIAHEIPNVLEGEDINYYIKTREDRIKGPITKFKPKISEFIKEFNKLINPIRKIIDANGFIAGKEPGIEDYIFFGNFKWVSCCSSSNLLEIKDPIHRWFKDLTKIADKVK